METANDIVCGLVAGAWTRSIRRAITMAEGIRAGTVWVNTYRAVSYMSPLGGFKRSGLVRENGQEAVLQSLRTESGWINTSNNVPNLFVLR